MRTDFPCDPAAFLRQLRAFRKAMCSVRLEVTYEGPIYRGASMLIHGIDGLGQWLTGERDYFAHGGAGTSFTDQQRAHWGRWDAIERGELPWPR